MKSLISSTSDKGKPKKSPISLDDSNVFDNKLLYDKVSSLRELEAADNNHPLGPQTESNESISEHDTNMQQITAELESVALDWKTLRNITECNCSTPFDHFSRKASQFVYFNAH